jgi:hypothetical protein
MNPVIRRFGIAAYSRWINARLYAAALALPDEP